MSDDDQPEPAEEKGTETSQKRDSEAPSEGDVGGGSDGQPHIEADEQANVPDGLADIDPEEAEAAAGADDEGDDQENTETDTEGDIADPSGSGGTAVDTSPLKAGNLYVSVVQSVTNAQIEKYGGPEAEQLEDEHFEQYDLATHFNETMDYMGVGSDMEPHEALLLATVLSVGDGLVSETDVLNQQVNHLMDKAMNSDDSGVSA